jgi:hypothetical protein
LIENKIFIYNFVFHYFSEVVFWKVNNGRKLSSTIFGVKVKELRISQNEEIILILLHNNEFICYKNFNEKINFGILTDEDKNSNLLLIDYIDDYQFDENLVVFNAVDFNNYKFYQLIFNSSATRLDKPIIKIHELIGNEKIHRNNNMMIVTEKKELLFIDKQFKNFQIYQMNNSDEKNIENKNSKIIFENKEDETLLNEYFEINSEKQLNYYLLNSSYGSYFILVGTSSDVKNINRPDINKSGVVIKAKLIRTQGELLIENVFFNISSVCTQPDAICVCINENVGLKNSETTIYVKNYKESSEKRLTIEQNLQINLVAIDSKVEYLAFNDISKVISLYRISDAKKLASVPIYDYGIHMKFSMDNNFLCLTTRDKRVFTMLVIDNDDPTHHNRLMKLSRYCKLEGDKKNFVRDTSRTMKVIDKDFTESNDEDDEENENNLVKNKGKL